MSPSIPLRHNATRSFEAELDFARWASDLGIAGRQVLGVELGPRDVTMAHSKATAEALVSNGDLGADVIRLAAGEGFAPHTHPGDHLLVILGGEGTIACRGRIHPTHAGEIYLIAGHEPHAVGAITDHVILAIGSPHRAIDAPDRMTLVEYEAITAEFHDLHCLVCNVHARAPHRLHESGCGHCPCVECHPV